MLPSRTAQGRVLLARPANETIFQRPKEAHVGRTEQTPQLIPVKIRIHSLSPPTCAAAIFACLLTCTCPSTSVSCHCLDQAGLSTATATFQTLPPTFLSQSLHHLFGVVPLFFTLELELLPAFALPFAGVPLQAPGDFCLSPPSAAWSFGALPNSDEPIDKPGAVWSSHPLHHPAGRDEDELSARGRHSQHTALKHRRPVATLKRHTEEK